MNQKKRKILSVILAFITTITFVASCYVGTAKKSYAASDYLTVYEAGSLRYLDITYRGVKAAVIKYRTSNNEVCYCTEQDFKGPGVSGVEYENMGSSRNVSSDSANGIQAILSYGYIGHGDEEIFNNFNLTEDQAECATATAIKLLLCHNNEPHSSVGNYSVEPMNGFNPV